MKPTLLVLLCTLAAIPLAYSQCTCSNELLYDAERAYRSDFDPVKSIKLYRQAFANRVTDGSKYLEAVECAAMIGDTGAALFFLEKGLSIGLTTKDYLKLWGRLGKGIPYGYAMKRMDTSSVARYTMALNADIRKELAVMAARDQQFRKTDGNEDRQRVLDSMNWTALQMMVTQLGRLPTYTETGFDGAEDLEILFYHMDKNEIEWLLPYCMESIRCGESNLGEVILYQVDRIGMSEGVIYTIRDDGTIHKLADRTRMKNMYWCQAFGQWYDEQSADRKIYETPIDPNISMEEVNRVRKLFCLDSMESKRMRKPWAAVVDIETFEAKIKS